MGADARLLQAGARSTALKHAPAPVHDARTHGFDVRYCLVRVHVQVSVGSKKHVWGVDSKDCIYKWKKGTWQVGRQP